MIKKIRIALLTSSRADYSIYLPLLRELSNDARIKLNIIAFGSHLSDLYGNSIKQITNDGFFVTDKVHTILHGDSPFRISQSMGLTINGFAKLWKKKKYELIVCLGDRYEMFAAVSASIPFNIPIAHISGGETTKGAIDNVFRDGLTIMSSLHFTSTEIYKNRVVELKGSSDNIYNVGALSIDNLKRLKLYTKDEFKKIFKIDLNKQSILITFHPETVSYKENVIHIRELIAALSKLKDFQLIITMPNADTMGNMIRKELNKFIKKTPNSYGVESLGTIGYLSCMKYCTMLLGNTSSGFVEASYFPKYVINLGDRQNGRILTPNIFSIPTKEKEILKKVEQIKKMPAPKKINLYGNGNAAKMIKKQLITSMSPNMVNVNNILN